MPTQIGFLLQDDSTETLLTARDFFRFLNGQVSSGYGDDFHVEPYAVYRIVDPVPLDLTVNGEPKKTQSYLQRWFARFPGKLVVLGQAYKIRSAHSFAMSNYCNQHPNHPPMLRDWSGAMQYLDQSTPLVTFEMQMYNLKGDMTAQVKYDMDCWSTQLAVIKYGSECTSDQKAECYELIVRHEEASCNQHFESSLKEVSDLAVKDAVEPPPKRRFVGCCQQTDHEIKEDLVRNAETRLDYACAVRKVLDDMDMRDKVDCENAN
jgi:hypothetical protein